MTPSSRFTWAAAIGLPLIITFSGIYLSNFEKMSSTGRMLLCSIFGTILLFLLVFVIFYDGIAAVVKNVSYRLAKNYSPFIYNTVWIRLEYLTNDGSRVAYERHNHISKLSVRKRHTSVDQMVTCSGTIIPETVTTLNSGYRLVNPHKAVFNTYINKKYFVRKEHYSSSSLIFQDGFLNKQEAWYITTDRFCNKFRVDVFLPGGRPLKHALLQTCEEKRNSKVEMLPQARKANWEQVDDPNVIIFYRGNYTVVSVRIGNVEPNRQYKILWEFL